MQGEPYSDNRSFDIPLPFVISAIFPSWLSRNLKALKLLSFPTPHRTPGISDLEHCPLYFSNYRKPLKKQL